MFLDLEVGNLIEPLTGRFWNHAEIFRQVAARTDHYRRQGLAPGDRVFLHFGNDLEFFADLLALWNLRASFVPIDSRLTAFEVENLARAVNPRFSLVNCKTDPSVVASMRSMAEKTLDTQDLSLSTAPLRNQPSTAEARLDDEALILFTSGSTGKPKGVVHTHRSLRARWSALRDCLGIEPYQRTLCLLPTHFGHGLICNCLFPWLSGQDLLIVPPFDTDLMMRLGAFVDQHKVTFFSSVPSMWGLILKASKSPRNGTLRRVHCGSAPLSGHLWKQIQDWADTKKVLNTYGITETASWLAGTTLEQFSPEDGLIGVSWGSLIKILKSSDPDALFDNDSVCKPGEAGYVWINSPALMRGYFKQPELTDQVVRGGWFFTGDIGLFDDQARFYLRGREREEINKGGTKIYPSDIDAVVARFDQTLEVCTFGFADSLYGQDVGMAIVLKKDDPATIQSLHEWMKRHLAEFKMPRRWYVTDSLPRTSRGKVNRSAVMESCMQRTPLDLHRILRGEL